MAYLSDKKPPELTALTTLADDDNVIVGDTSDASEDAKSITWANVKTMLGTLYASIIHTHTKSEITDLNAYEVGGTDVAVADGGTGASTAAGARTALGVDPAGTDNSTDVTLAGTGTYISIAGQVITVDPITESDIANLGAYITDVTGSPLSELSDVTITTIASGEVLKWNGTAWINQTLTEAGIQAILTEGAFVDGDKTKLDGIEASADVTDTTNVTAAGALMDSELADIAGVKALTGTNTGDVTLAGTPNYITIVGQVITRALINLTSHVTGILPIANGGTASSTASGARTALGAGTMSNVVEDTTPQAGGNFDLNGNPAGDATEFDNGNSGTSKTIVWDNGSYQKITMTANATLTFTAPTLKGRYQMRFIQDATGSRTVTHPTIKTAGGTGITLTTTANAVDIVTYYWDGVSHHAVNSLDFK